MTDTMTSQNIDFSSWDTLYMVYIYYSYYHEIKFVVNVRGRLILLLLLLPLLGQHYSPVLTFGLLMDFLTAVFFYPSF